MSMNSCAMDCLDYQKLGVLAQDGMQLMTKCISWDYCFHFGRKPACLLRAHTDGKGELTWKGKSNCRGRRQNCVSWEQITPECDLSTSHFYVRSL